MSAVMIAIVALPAMSLLLAGLTRMESLLTAGLDEQTVTGSTMAGSTRAGSTRAGSTRAEPVVGGPVTGIDDVGALAA